MPSDSSSSTDLPTAGDTLTQKQRDLAQSLLEALRKVEALETRETPQPDTERSAPTPPRSYTDEEEALMTQLCDLLAHPDLRSAWGIPSSGTQPALRGTQGMPSDELDSALPGFGVPAEIAGIEENGDNDMGLFDKHRICICSEVDGVITRDGRPLAGAEVIRHLDLFLPKDRVYTDSTRTDAKGCFSFPPAYARKWKHRLGEVRTTQRILVRHEGRTYLGWSNISSGRELHEDIFEPAVGRAFFRLQFFGDLARATPLPDQPEEEHRFPKELCFFNTQTVCVASWLRFTVTMNGEPAAGARVVRTAEFVGIGGFEQSKETDRDGEIELPAIYTPRLVHKDAKIEIHQRIVISYQGKDYLAWEKTKTNPWKRGEYNRDEDKWGYEVEIEAELSENDSVVRGVKTDPQRRWSDDLPDDFIRYRGIFKVTRFK